MNSGVVRRTNVWLWLTLPIAILLVLAAGGGVFISGLYRDNPYFVAQAVGQDRMSLAVVLPTIVASAFLASRGSHRARLVWLGGLIYLVYTYVIAAFDNRYNALAVNPESWTGLDPRNCGEATTMAAESR